MQRCIALGLFFSAAVAAQAPRPHLAWSGDKVHEIRLKFENADWYDVLRRNYSGTEANNPYFPASLEWDGYKFATVGVRFKGNSSYSASNTQKKPFRIKTNEFVKGQKIDGVGAFNLNNVWNDPSFVREPLYYEFAARLGLKSPRTNYAALYINDRYWGLYILGEVVNEDFLQSHLGKDEDTGNMYKGNIGATFAYLGENPTPYKSVWEKQTNEEADDWRDLIALCKLINDTQVADLRTALEPIMDVDSVLTALALDNATVNLDSYVGMSQNFNLYRRPSDGRWVWIVWDPSLAFGALSQGQTIEGMKTLALEWVNTGTGLPGGGGPGGPAGRPLATKLWAVPEYRERYRQIYKNLTENVFKADSTLTRMNQLRDLIRPFVQADTQKLVSMTQFDNAMTTNVTSTAPGGIGGDRGIPALQPFVEGRLTAVAGLLNGTASPTALISSSAAALNFTQSVTGSAPATQTVSLGITGAALRASYGVVGVVESGADTWLTVTPASGILPGDFKVSVTAKALGPGEYRATLTIRTVGLTPQTILVPVSFTVTGAGTPAISAVVNSASYAVGGVAPGEIVTIFGTAMGPTKIAAGASNGTSWPSDLSGVRVTFDGVAAPLLYVRADQIGAVVPFEVVGRSQSSVRVSFGNGTSAVTNVPVAGTLPGIFTLDASGTGQGAILNQNSTVNGTSAPAAKGSIVAIFLTGAGQTNTNSTTGGLGQVGQNVNATVLIGGQPATVVYAGAAPGNVSGLYQINATVPAGSAAGRVPVSVTVGGVTSQSGVTLTVQ